MAPPLLVNTAALDVAKADVVPMPKNTTTEAVLTMRYWLGPSVAPAACTGVGAVVAAVKVTVLPSGVNALMPMVTSFVRFAVQFIEDLLEDILNL